MSFGDYLKGDAAKRFAQKAKEYAIETAKNAVQGLVSSGGNALSGISGGREVEKGQEGSPRAKSEKSVDINQSSLPESKVLEENNKVLQKELLELVEFSKRIYSSSDKEFKWLQSCKKNAQESDFLLSVGRYLKDASNLIEAKNDPVLIMNNFVEKLTNLLSSDNPESKQFIRNDIVEIATNTIVLNQMKNDSQSLRVELAKRLLKEEARDNLSTSDSEALKAARLKLIHNGNEFDSLIGNESLKEKNNDQLRAIKNNIITLLGNNAAVTKVVQQYFELNYGMFI